MTLRVLLVEDDRELRATLRDALAVEGYGVLTAASLSEALALSRNAGRADHGGSDGPDASGGDDHRGGRFDDPAGHVDRTGHAGIAHGLDIVLLDLGLPDGDGESLLVRLRRSAHVPVIVISARQADTQKIRLLDAGADDYLVKPFGIGELLARMRVALRHRGNTTRAAVTHYSHDGLEVDLAATTIRLHGESVHLTPTEFKLLARLVRQAGQCVTHRALLADVWGGEFVEHTHYLRLYMQQLRAKLEREPAEPRLLLTEPGVGYRIVEPDDDGG